jgi:hypothetical protein
MSWPTKPRIGVFQPLVAGRLRNAILGTERAAMVNRCNDSGVVWSRVAAKTVELQEKKMETKKAIERLRASRQNAEEEDLRFGFHWGKNWAKEKAEWPELLAVASIDTEAGISVDELIELHEFQL